MEGVLLKGILYPARSQDTFNTLDHTKNTSAIRFPSMGDFVDDDGLR